MSPVHLAQYLVNRFGSMPGGVTPMKVQKLLYYVKAWSVVDGHDLVDGDFKRWPYGPVNQEVYQHFKPHRAQPIQPVALGPHQEPKGEAKRFVDFIGNSYARFSAVALSAMTHREDPWKDAVGGQVIAPEAMEVYYARQPFAQNLPFDPTKPYIAVQSDLGRAFTMDMNEEDARRAATWASYNAYLAHLQKAGYVPEGEWLSRLLA